MSKHSLFFVLSACLILLVSSAYRPARLLVGEGVCVYEKPMFKGRSQCWCSNTFIPDLRSDNFKDKISSVRVFGHAELVGYHDTMFHGERIIIDHDVLDLTNYPLRSFGNWDHGIESLDVQTRAG